MKMISRIEPTISAGNFAHRPVMMDSGFVLFMATKGRVSDEGARAPPQPRSAALSTAYELTFELENKEVKRFYVSPDTFSLVFENNRGILTYKEHAKAVFVDFEVLEING